MERNRQWSRLRTLRLPGGPAILMLSLALVGIGLEGDGSTGQEKPSRLRNEAISSALVAAARVDYRRKALRRRLARPRASRPATTLARPVSFLAQPGVKSVGAERALVPETGYRR